MFTTNQIIRRLLKKYRPEFVEFIQKQKSEDAYLIEFGSSKAYCWGYLSSSLIHALVNNILFLWKPWSSNKIPFQKKKIHELVLQATVSGALFDYSKNKLSPPVKEKEKRKL